MVAARVTIDGRRGSSGDTIRLIVAAVAVVVATVATEGTSNVDLANMIGEIVVGFATATTIVVLASAGPDVSGVSTALRRALSWGPLRSVGRASYSLYLVHYPIVAVIYLTVIRDQGWGVPDSMLALTVLPAPVIVAATLVVYYSAERPFLHRPTQRVHTVGSAAHRPAGQHRSERPAEAPGRPLRTTTNPAREPRPTASDQAPVSSRQPAG